MTPTTLFANLRSLQREQPATYGSALCAAPGWVEHRSNHGHGAMWELALLQMIAGIGGRRDQLLHGPLRHL